MKERQKEAISSQHTATSNQEEEYIIPVEGSLSLFALGAKGLRAWRKVRDTHLENVSHLRNVKHL